MIFIQFSFVTRGRDRWCLLKKWKMKNEKRKSTRMPLSEESKTSEVTLRQFDTLAFPHIYLIIHTNRGNPISSAFVIRFHLYLCYPMLFTLPIQETFTQISSFSFYIQTGAIYMNCFPFRINLLYYLYFLLNQVVHTLQA